MITPQTWHHGLIADWWASMNVDAPEIEAYRGYIDHGEGPILDGGCGAGRLLVPWLRRGFDVDGCDASADMIDRCRERARRRSRAEALGCAAAYARRASAVRDDRGLRSLRPR